MAIKLLNAKKWAVIEAKQKEKDFRRMLKTYLPMVLDELIKTGKIKISLQ